MIRVLALLLALAACTQEPRSVPNTYRDQSVAITSSTRFEARRFGGEWQIIESVGAGTRAFPCETAFHLYLEDEYARYSCVFPPSPQGIDWELAFFELEISEFGRLKYTNGLSASDPIWVLWVDEDHRTAVLGTPSGRFGMIINRTKTLRSDRLRAARDILAFNGYDLSQLRAK